MNTHRHTMSTRRAFGIRAKIILPLAGVAIAVSIVGVALIHSAQVRQSHRQLQDRAAAIAHAVVHMAETTSDSRQLQRFVALLSSEAGVEMIVVAAGEPMTVVASSRPEWTGRPVSELPDPTHTRNCLEHAFASGAVCVEHDHNQNGELDFSLPLRTRLRQTNALSRAPGAVMLHLDVRELRTELYTETVRLIATFLSAIALSCFVAYILLWRIVIAPVGKIAEVARRTVAGTHNARVGWSRDDELGQLARQFDSMLDEIVSREELEQRAREQAISAQRSAEAVLAELRCFKFALDQHAIVAVTDPKGEITYANERFTEISKYSEEELIGQTHRIINSGYHPPEFWASMWDAVSTGDVWSGEVCNRAKDGTVYWVDTTIVPFRDNVGKITQYVAIRADITQRKDAEASLEEREEQFRTLVNNIPGVPYRCLDDNEWTMQFIGEAVAELTGYPASDFIGNAVRSYCSVIHPNDVHRVLSDVRLAIEQGQSYTLEYRIVRADGQIRVVSEQGQVVGNDDERSGRHLCLDGAIFDISDRKEAEQALLDERARLAAFVEHAPAAIVMLDREFRCVAVSQRFVSDYNLDGQSIVGSSYYDVMPHLPERWKEVNQLGLQGEVTVCDEDGWTPPWSESAVVLRWEVRPWRMADGEIGGILVFTEDITEMKRTDAALRESKEQFELAVRGSNDGIWDWNVQNGTVFYSRRYRELLGYKEDKEFPGRFESFEKHLHPEDAPATLHTLAEHLRDGVPYDVTFRLRTASGQWRWFRSRGEAVRDEDGRARRMAGSISDISSLKDVEQELLRAARLDRLTGLPNRGLFLDRLQAAIQRSSRAQDHTFAVMFLDFDRFKIINDSLGHDVGDALLVEIADKLRDNIRAVDSISANMSGNLSARLGGDEFVVLLEELRGVEDAEKIADHLLAAFSQPHQLGKHEVYSTASIGIVMGEPSYQRAEDIVRDADTAMYEAKRLGKARYVVFDASMRERVQRHLKLESDLRKAIGQPQLEMHYQPIISLQTGALYGVEALVRWNHPVEGAIEPTEFIPIAEESNLIISLGDWAIERCFLQMVEWQDSMGPLAPKRICINLSRKQFALPSLPARLREILQVTGVEPGQIQIEVTEDALVGDAAAAVKTMQAIKDLGIELAIDGFGSGSSSFASLHEFPVDVLKIDRSMLTGIEDSNDIASMIHGLAVMVKNLGLDMVAEGVETPGQVISLQELGCDFAQGFLFAEALLPDEIPEFAARNLSLECHARGATAYANQWGERLTVFQSFGNQETTESV